MTLNWVSWSANSDCGHLVELEMFEFSEKHYRGVAFYTVRNISDERILWRGQLFSAANALVLVH